jgi:toxin YoeB
MRIAFTSEGWEDYQYWQENNLENLEKVNKLIKEILKEPFKGTGKPEPLRGNLSGYWSRRITGEHRLVYRVEGNKSSQILIIIQARFHYS